jgi:predicted glycosyltransferase involved in capsule biosynthesis
MSFSYVIPHKSSTPDRDRNLTTVIKYIKSNFRDIDIVLVQQGTEYTIDFPGVNNSLVRKTGLFHKAKIFNTCYKKARFDKIVFADNDMIVSKDAIEQMILLLDNYDAVSPYNAVNDINADDTTAFCKNIDINYLKGLDINYREGIPFAGGVVAFTRKGYSKIGGFDEEMVGWGAEDNLVSYKIKKILNYFEMEGIAFHLNHIVTVLDTCNQNNYNNNCAYMKNIESLNDEELLKYCETKERLLNS